MPDINFDDCETLQEAVGQAIGAASMCWNPIPTGVFDPQAASKIIDALMKTIEKYY